jgi:hypothetical protein
VSYAQLAILPLIDGRNAERRIVNLAARLREPGAKIADADVMNLSIDGYMARTELTLEVGANVWLKLPGVEPQNSRVIWVEDGKAGFQFAASLHPATLELIVANGRKPIPKRHFGPQDHLPPR